MIGPMTDTTPILPPLTRNQRVVFQHVHGPHPGLFQIGGHTNDFNGQQPPDILGPFKALGRSVTASLVRSTPRYVLYREIAPPKGLGRFDRRQR